LLSLRTRFFSPEAARRVSQTASCKTPPAYLLPRAQLHARQATVMFARLAAAPPFESGMRLSPVNGFSRLPWHPPTFDFPCWSSGIQQLAQQVLACPLFGSPRFGAPYGLAPLRASGPQELASYARADRRNFLPTRPGSALAGSKVGPLLTQPKQRISAYVRPPWPFGVARLGTTARNA